MDITELLTFVVKNKASDLQIIARTIKVVFFDRNAY